MTDNTDFELNETLSESEETVTPQDTELYDGLIERYFGILPKEIKNRLADFVREYPFGDVKYNRFAVDFNNFLNRQFAEIWFGDKENDLFFGYKTKYKTNKEFWKQCAEYVKDDRHISTLEFLQIARRVVKNDGFSLAVEFYD